MSDREKLLYLKQELRNCTTISMQDREMMIHKIDKVLIQGMDYIRPDKILTQMKIFDQKKSKIEIMKDFVKIAVEKNLYAPSDIRSLLKRPEFNSLSFHEAYDNVKDALDSRIKYEALTIVQDLSVQQAVYADLDDEFQYMDLEKAVRKAKPNLTREVFDRVVNLLWSQTST